MAFVSPRMSLKVWNAPSDPYDHEQLADNWLKVDQHDHSPGRGVPIGSAGIQPGAITATHLSSQAVTLAALSPELNVEPVYDRYMTLRSGVGKLTSSGNINDFFLIAPHFPDTVAVNTAAALPSLFWFDPADLAVPGKTLKLRLRATLFAYGGTPTTGNITVAFYTQGQNTITTGGAPSGVNVKISPSDVVFPTPANGSVTTQVSQDFTPPVASNCSMCMNTTASIAVGSTVIVSGQLLYRYV